MKKGSAIIKILMLGIVLAISPKMFSYSGVPGQGNLPSESTYEDLDFSGSVLPSDSYYQQNLQGVDATDPDDEADPGGEDTGNGGNVGETPVGDGLIPLGIGMLLYGTFIFYRNRRKNTTTVA